MRRSVGIRLWAAILTIAEVCSCGGTDPSDNPRSHYEAAREAYAAGKYEDAVRRGLLTLESAGKSDSIVWQARAHELMADTYRAVYNLKAARRHRTEAITLYKKAGKPENAFYAYADLAGEYSHERNDSAYVMMEEARRLMQPGNREQLDQYDFMYADICRVMGDYPKALAHLRRIRPAWLTGVLTPTDSVHLGETYYRNAIPDSAAIFFSTPAAHDDIQYWECMAEQYEQSGDPHSANVCLRNIMNLEYEKGATSLSNTLEFEERSFYRDRAARARESHDRLLRYVLAIGSILMITVLALLAWRWRTRSRRLKTENEIMDVALISQQTPDNPVETECTEDSPEAQTDPAPETDDNWIYVILDFYMSRLNDISREYFKATDEDEHRAIEVEFNRELKSLRGGDIFDEIEKRVNDRNDDIVKRIRRIFPKFNEQNIRLMMCHLAGLSSQSACLLLSVEKGNFYVIWSRIRAKIRALDHPDRDELMSLFCTK